MIETFWRKHYHPGVTGSFHGDMAHAFAAILADDDAKFYASMIYAVKRSIRAHYVKKYRRVVRYYERKTVAAKGQTK